MGQPNAKGVDAMRRWMTLTAAIACVLTLTWGAATAQAEPSTQTWEFTSCTGPAGTPTSFSAWRTSQSLGNALHLVDGSGSFVVLIAYNNDLGTYNVPVLAPGKTSAAPVQCSTIGPALGFHLTVWGLFAP
jgi:hypothetical protein